MGTESKVHPPTPKQDCPRPWASPVPCPLGWGRISGLFPSFLWLKTWNPESYKVFDLFSFPNLHNLKAK